jgi:hypothetical protein
MAVGFETAMYGFIGLVAQRGVTAPADDDLLAGPLTVVTETNELAVAPWPKAS